MRTKIAYLFLLCFMLFSCADEKESKSDKSIPKSVKQKEGLQNLNISILLDLSDRIDTVKYHNSAMEQYQRDAHYISTVAKNFVNHLRNKRVRSLDDKISIFFDPVPKNPQINQLSSDLKFHITRQNASLELLDNIETTYSKIPVQIYELALKDGKYVGSDTWGFFKNKVKNFCVEENYRNVLVILTDGYIFHKDNKRIEGTQTSYLVPQLIRANGLNKSDWKTKIEDKEYGFIPANNELENLEVLVLGIRPDSDNVYEEEVIKFYWKEWFENMDVGRNDIRSNDLPTDMEKIIDDFFIGK